MSCAPSALKVTENDIDQGHAFLINIIHVYGSRAVSDITGSILRGKDTYKNADQVYVFRDKQYLSGLSGVGTGGTTMGQLLSIPTASAEIEVDVYRHIPKELMGFKILNLSPKPDETYAVVTEVEKSTENVHLDVYSISLDQLKDILSTSKEYSTFEFGENNYQ